MNTPREEGMRAEFEEWFASQPENGGKRPNRADRGDGYYTASTQRMWESWQAATQRERERCAQIALDEKVDAETTGDATDAAYNIACEQIAASIVKSQSNGRSE